MEDFKPMNENELKLMEINLCKKFGISFTLNLEESNDDLKQYDYYNKEDCFTINLCYGSNYNTIILILEKPDNKIFGHNHKFYEYYENKDYDKIVKVIINHNPYLINKNIKHLSKGGEHF